MRFVPEPSAVSDRSGRLVGYAPSVAVGAAGVVLLHQVAYLLAHPDSVGRGAATQGHAYLAFVGEVLIPLGMALAVWLAACRAGRLLGGARMSLGVLILLQAALFLGQEVLERVAAGEGARSALSEPAVWVGLALVPVLAWATGQLLAVADRLQSCRGWYPTDLVVAGWGLRLALPDLWMAGTAPPAVHRARGPPFVPD